MHILLTEDNVVNQRLAVRLLERQGYSVTVANNGHEALAALERDRYDLILMDVQMPEMDGFEATAIIRGQERVTGSHLPIIAMTGQTMKGDRERCLEVGMDGYLAKPIQAEELFKITAEIACANVKAEIETVVSEPPAAAFDQTVALAQVGGDLELLAELVELFVSDSPKLMAEIQQSIARGEHAGVERAAHTLKGAASNFGAKGVVKVAQHLEEIGRAGRLVESPAACEALAGEIVRLNAALGAFLTQSSA